MSSKLVDKIARKHNISRNKARKLIDQVKEEINERRALRMLKFTLRDKFEKREDENEGDYNEIYTPT